MCSCLGLAINVRIVWRRFSSFLDLFVSGSTINVRIVWCRFSSFLDLSLSVVTYQRTYCLVPFLQFSRSVPVCGQLSTYVLFGAVSPVF